VKVKAAKAVNRHQPAEEHGTNVQGVGNSTELACGTQHALPKDRGGGGGGGGGGV